MMRRYLKTGSEQTRFPILRDQANRMKEVGERATHQSTTDHKTRRDLSQGTAQMTKETNKFVNWDEDKTRL